jgi:hypothetical protein
LLFIFTWLVWSGWNEYRKVEAYKIWAEDFDNAKFDIYAVLGKKERQITWGKPTRKGMINLDSFSLDDVQKINLLVSDKSIDIAKSEGLDSQPLPTVDLDNLPSKGKTALEFIFAGQKPPLRIPFTDISLAAKWFNYLQQN